MLVRQWTSHPPTSILEGWMVPLSIAICPEKSLMFCSPPPFRYFTLKLNERTFHSACVVYSVVVVEVWGLKKKTNRKGK